VEEEIHSEGRQSVKHRPSGVTRLVVGVIVGGFAILTVAGCAETKESASPPVPTASQMTGVWKHGAGTSITLYSSGDAAFVNVPMDLLYGKGPKTFHPHKGPWKGLVTVDGTWQPPSDEGQILPVMEGAVAGSGYELYVEGTSDATRRIVMFYGDDLEWKYTLTRASGVTPTESPATN
jgi:hypothetical protein